MPQGAFYAFPRVTKISKDSRTAARMLLTKAHVATIPGVVFGGQGEGHVRFGYAIDPRPSKRVWRRSESTSSPKGCSQGVPCEGTFFACRTLLLRFVRQI
jgi:aspartate/methionine/tyrosine aminotransferase